jgi:AraC-like DNA-binding protein
LEREECLARDGRANPFPSVADDSSEADTGSSGSLSLGTSPYHLCRVFRDCTGLTLHQHRSELRVRAALEMLEATAGAKPSLSHVAHTLGFSSHSHFVQAMRRHAGVTPGVARSLVG